MSSGNIGFSQGRRAPSMITAELGHTYRWLVNGKTYTQIDTGVSNNWVENDAIDNEFITFSREFTQDEVRTLNTANGGYGPELLPDPGENAYQIIDPIYVWKMKVGGRLLGGALDIYAIGQSYSYFSGGIKNFISIQDQRFVDFPNAVDVPVISPITNEYQSIVLWSSIEQNEYIGTLVV